MSIIRAGSQSARAAWRSTASRPAARSARSARASCLGSRRQAAWIAVVSAGTVLLAAACGSSSPGPAASPAGMLTAPGYDAAFRACLKLAVIGGGSRARYQAAALHGVRQAECMRAHGITSYPSPGALDGGIHSPDFTAVGLDPHTLQFQAAAKACGMGPAWQAMWWWPAAAAQPGQDTQGQYSRARRAN